MGEVTLCILMLSTKPNWISEGSQTIDQQFILWSITQAHMHVVHPRDEQEMSWTFARLTGAYNGHSNTFDTHEYILICIDTHSWTTQQVKGSCRQPCDLIPVLGILVSLQSTAVTLSHGQINHFTSRWSWMSLMCVKVGEMKQPSPEAIGSERDRIVPQLFGVVLGYNPNLQWGWIEDSLRMRQGYAEVTTLTEMIMRT